MSPFIIVFSSLVIVGACFLLAIWGSGREGVLGWSAFGAAALVIAALLAAIVTQ